jgi:hypothetical protein
MSKQHLFALSKAAHPPRKQGENTRVQGYGWRRGGSRMAIEVVDGKLYLEQSQSLAEE